MSKCLVSELLETDCISDIPEFEIQEKLNRLSKADSKDQMSLMVAIDERYDAGIPTVSDMSAKEFVKQIVHYRLISLNQKEIDQVKDGLSFGDVLQTMKSFKEDGTKELI